MSLICHSPCKINLLLNILGKRADGFHELETVMHPVPLHDLIHLDQAVSGIQLTCNRPDLAVDASNLVHRAAAAFLATANIPSGVRIHLEKHVPMAAGLGGGSGNAATTLLGLNELFGHPLTLEQLHPLAATLGSDVPFFLQKQPALATGRGEIIRPLESFPTLSDVYILLIHPGFGIATAWAYRELARFPEALNGRAGRAQELVNLLQKGSLSAAGSAFYNSLEAPALEKYPLLVVFQEFFRAHGAAAVMMSGSGSTTFALVQGKVEAECAVARFKEKFGESYWTSLLKLA